MVQHHDRHSQKPLIRSLLYSNPRVQITAKCRQTSTATVSQPVSNENVLAKLLGLFVA